MTAEQLFPAWDKEPPMLMFESYHKKINTLFLLIIIVIIIIFFSQDDTIATIRVVYHLIALVLSIISVIGNFLFVENFCMFNNNSFC